MLSSSTYTMSIIVRGENSYCIFIVRLMPFVCSKTEYKLLSLWCYCELIINQAVSVYDYIICSKLRLNQSHSYIYFSSFYLHGVKIAVRLHDCIIHVCAFWGLTQLRDFPPGESCFSVSCWLHCYISGWTVGRGVTQTLCDVISQVTTVWRRKKKRETALCLQLSWLLTLVCFVFFFVCFNERTVLCFVQSIRKKTVGGT